MKLLAGSWHYGPVMNWHSLIVLDGKRRSYLLPVECADLMACRGKGSARGRPSHVCIFPDLSIGFYPTPDRDYDILQPSVEAPLLVC